MENFAIIDNNKICIKLCGSDTPHFGMLLNHKEVLLYFKDGKLIPVTYERIGDIKDSRYLILNSEGIINEVPVSALELPNSLKKDAFKLITNLAQALEIIDSSSPKSLNFTAPWLFYSLPLNGIWFTKDGGVLLFPKQVTDIIDTFISDDERNINWKRFFVHNTVEDYGKAHFLSQLVYFSITGEAPFGSEASASNGYKALTLSSRFAPDSKAYKLGLFIDKTFNANKKTMYAALENNGPYSYFLKNFVNLTNNLTIEECEITDTNKYLKEKNNFEKRSNILKFIRQKGLLTLTITIGAITLLSIIWHFIWNAIKPPITKDLNQVEIIEYVIEGINSLSPDFSEPFSSDKNNPYYTIVTSNYVTGAMRMAYENATAYYTPDQWESSNLEALPLYSRIFGIKDLEIEQIDELTFVLTYKEYGDGGFYYEEGIDPDKDLTALPIGIFVEIRNVEAEIVFKVRRSWYEIESMVITKDDVIQTFSVPYSK